MRRIYSAMQRRDADELRTTLAHDIEWTLPEGVPWGGSLIDIFQAHVEGSWADPDDVETHSLMSFRARWQPRPSRCV